MTSELSPPRLTVLLFSLLTTGALCTGCTQPTEQASEHAAADTPASTSSSPTIHPSALDPNRPFPIGDFDSTDPNFRPRDICAEITDEMAMEAGLGDRNAIQGSLQHDLMKACLFYPNDSTDYTPPSFLIISDSAPKENVIRGTDIFKDPSYSDLPGFYTYRFPNDNDACSAALTTKEGRISLTVQEVNTSKSPEQMCSDAAEKLRTIYLSIGGVHEHQS